MNPAPSAFRAPSALERIFNRAFGFVVGIGWGFSYNYLLQVRGRKSGNLYSTPVNLLEIGGKKFLVAPRGRTQWVRNAEAAGEIMLKKGSARQQFRLRPLAGDEKLADPESLSRYLPTRGPALLPGSRRFPGRGLRRAG